ncbi:efflux RND transporter periplasmic adaptor subunit [Pseudomonas sp. SED1]|uniref:efflux RND transporter periplasmic adaptor subunit n=1 Tax=Pseudomonas sp. SED1 TaxID=3056845 RepID=UPI00296E683C|nr:HlyD family efflux transporter periplasmic adaptor subunit [Pseudomonas sp. SED1]MDY0834637.1 HlyD family efflux transporter periplasmic adaptor subunit [Pseudomonas sp. SED1]
MMIKNSVSRQLLVGGAVLLAMVTGGLIFGAGTPGVSAGSDANWLAVQPGPLVRQIALAGRIEAHHTVILTAPFDGNVLIKQVEEGQQVTAGQVLLSIDPAQVQTQLREALAVQLKARRAVRELEEWDNGGAVVRARRAVRTAQMLMSNLTHKLEESSQLFDRGIIARNELDDLKQQVQMQHLELAAAHGELKQVLEQGTGEHRQIADMELTNATVKYEALQQLLAGREVMAPFDGVVLPLPASQGAEPGAPPPLQAGSKVAQGQPLLSLANIEQLKVVAKVSELDVNQLRPGQAVEVLGDGFEGERLSGSVLGVNGLALADEGASRFAVTLSIARLTPEQLQRVRLGMSARLTIVTYRNDQALVVPPAAIAQEGDVHRVAYRKDLSQPEENLVVTTGQTTVQGVEVFGLPPGFVRIPKLLN